MPYITKDERMCYDEIIDMACEELHDPHCNSYIKEVINPGHLNYIITRICLDVFEKHTSYKTLALITGVLENVKQELYRRQFGDYEDEAIKKNGDL